MIDYVCFHVPLYEQYSFPNRADQMAPVLTHGTIQLVSAGKGQKFASLFHLIVKADLKALDLTKVGPGYHYTPSPYGHRPPSVFIPVESRNTKQGIALVQQGLGQCMKSDNRCRLIAQTLNGFIGGDSSFLLDITLPLNLDVSPFSLAVTSSNTLSLETPI